MDFFERQHRARRTTSLLVVYYLVAVVLIICSVYFAIVGAILLSGGSSGELSTEHFGALKGYLWNPKAFFFVTVATTIIVGVASAYKILSLRQGGAAVGMLMGGRPLPTNTTEPHERRLLNIVEEMALASGTPVPLVFVMESESGINAFAAGFSVNDAVVGVTRGCMELLSRDELQGVIAHEFSHILNGDMRLNIRLMGLLHGILVLGIIGSYLVRGGFHSSRYQYRYSSRNRDNEGGGLVFVGLALMAIGFLGVFFGKLIKSAVSRQREFLADASAVQFTRNPTGIAGALKKIGGLSLGSLVQNLHAEEASHFFFANGISSIFGNWMATHPPLPVRIKAIDPSFDGTFPVVKPLDAESYDARTSTQGAAFVAGMSQVAMTSREGSFSVRPEDFVEQVGSPTAAHLAYAREILDSLPADFRSRAQEPYGARAILYALLIARDDEISTKQLSHLSGNADKNVFQETMRVLPEMREIRREYYLPLVDLCIPALRSLSPEQFRSFEKNLEVLVHADSSVSLFEYVFLKVIKRHLGAHFQNQNLDLPQRFVELSQIIQPARALLSILAYSGHPTQELANTAYQAALRELDEFDRTDIVPAEKCSLSALDRILQNLAQSSPLLKRKILAAATRCAATDGTLTIAEVELLRSIADTLLCPVPPFFPGQSISLQQPS